MAPSGSEWLRPVPGPRSAACELRLKDSACGLAHPPYGVRGWGGRADPGGGVTVVRWLPKSTKSHYTE